MRLVIVALTENGKALGKTIQRLWPQEIPLFVTKKNADDTAQPFPHEKFSDSLHDFFKHYDGLICIMATGIVVRSLSGVIQDKRFDPAVVVLDEKGQHVISLLSGHIGGGNQLTQELATLLNSDPVITTATDVQDVTALDILAKEISAWYADFKSNTKRVNGLLAAHQKVGLIDEQGLVSDMRGLTKIDRDADLTEFAVVLLISDKAENFISEKVIQVVPRRYVLGMGCKKETAAATIHEEYLRFCQQQQLHPFCAKKIVSIDLKKAETGIIALADWLSVSFKTYTADALKKVAEKYPQSAFVKTTTGVGSVALAAADLASDGQVVTERYAHNGVTFALGFQIAQN